MWVMPAQDPGDLDEALDRALIRANGDPVYALSEIERAAVHAVYQLYDAVFGQPHLDLTPAALADAKSHLRDGYNQIQIGGRLEDLRSRLLASTDACPYCGFGEVKDLDHYLPRRHYGELALYPNNLIPSCSACNNAKRTVVPGMGEAYGPGLIHPYFQALPEVDFLKADIAFDAGALDVAFRIEAAEIDPDLAAKLQFQLDRLKLNERYPKQINKFLNEQRTAWLMFREIDVALFRDYLRRNAVSLASSFHRNDWRVALTRGLSETPGFYEDPMMYIGKELPTEAD